MVEIREDGLIFRGRSDDRFKLENGRWIPASVCEDRLRCGLPAIDESLLFTPDGKHLALAWSGDIADSPPDITQLRSALGPVGSLLRWAVRIPEPMWPRTLKGSIDRRAAEGRLMDLFRSSGGGLS